VVIWHLDTMNQRCRQALRGFGASLRLCGIPLTSIDDQRLLDIVRGHVRAGSLVGVREDPRATPKTGEDSARQRQLVRRIESAFRGRISVGGRSYKLVADIDLGKVPRREDHEVVRRDDAVKVLEALTAQHGGPDVRDLLGQASARLTCDWRPPVTEPNGLVLLRRLPVMAAVGVETGPALTPSQIVKLRAAEDSVSFEVVVLGPGGEPVRDLRSTIETPDGETHEDALDSSGRTRITSAKKGTASVKVVWAGGSTPA